MITDLDLNVQNLLNLIKDNEAARDFHLGFWFHEDEVQGDDVCGTYGCLCGNWAVAETRRAYRRDHGRDVKPYVQWLREFDIGVCRDTDVNFGLPMAFFDFLFNSTNSASLSDRLGFSRNPLDKDAAINRVRKLLYYYLRKRELLADGVTTTDSGEFDWRKYEQLRRTEGERQITSQVLEEVSA